MKEFYYELCSLWVAASGYKTHLLVVIAMVAVAMNHFHVLPEWIDLGDLKPENWLRDEWELALGSAVRSALERKGK